VKHEADLVSGPLYDYLGHFRQRRFLEQGHNDVGGEDTVEHNPGYTVASMPNQGTRTRGDDGTSNEDVIYRTPAQIPVPIKQGQSQVGVRQNDPKDM
jgi:hypothetical protein